MKGVVAVVNWVRKVGLSERGEGTSLKPVWVFDVSGGCVLSGKACSELAPLARNEGYDAGCAYMIAM